jgi:hypothetical protein
MPIDYDRFIAMLGAEFPEVISDFREDEMWMLLCEARWVWAILRQSLENQE